MIHLKLPECRVIGPPAGWDQPLDGGCGSIHVIDHVDVQSGLNQRFTFYRPSPEELEALANGGILRLGLLGTSHPGFNMLVLARTSGRAAEQRTPGTWERWWTQNNLGVERFSTLLLLLLVP